MSRFLQNLYGNILCAVDTETTGLDPQKHDIIQIAIIPADDNLKPHPNILPFILDIKPRRPENIEPRALYKNRKDFDMIMRYATDCWKAADLFVEWFDRIKTHEKCRIMPLAMNWPFDREFIIQWLGPKTYELYFHHHYRDAMAAAIFKNDCDSWHDRVLEFQGFRLKDLARQLETKNEGEHDAVSDAVTTMEVYRRIVQKFI